jgi:hypothetical protein
MARQLRRLTDVSPGDVCHPERGHAMIQVQEGQCGLSAHFGENHPREPQLIQIRLKHEAPEDFIDECGHPRHAPLHLRVPPISGCEGFESAPQVQTGD